MDQQMFSLMIALSVFLGAPTLYLYVWQKKHRSRLPWKAFFLCCFIVCGSALAASLFLGSVTDATSYAVVSAFQLDRETSALAAKLAVRLMATLPVSLAGVWVVKKIIH